MTKQRFIIQTTGWCVIDVDQTVIDAVDDEWRSCFYNLNTPKEIAAHIGSNLIRGLRLSQLDGWADQSDESAEIVDSVDWDTTAYEF